MGQKSVAQQEPRGRQWSWPALLALLLAAFLRCPPIFLYGRIWGEELPVFLIGGWNRSFAYSVFAPHFGYFSLWDNVLAAVAIHAVPLAGVSYLFTYSAVVILLVTGYLVWTAEFLTTPAARWLGVAALVLTAPSIETWLNLLNSEFYFGLWGAVLLLSDAARMRAWRALLLALAVLCGPLTTLMTPLYLLRAVRRRSSANTLQAAIVCVGACVQVGYAAASHIAHRSIQANPWLLGPVLFNKNVVLAFLNRAMAKGVYLLLVRLHFSTWVIALCWLLFAGACMFLAWAARRVHAALLLLGVALWMTLLEWTLALNGSLTMADTAQGDRYGFLPNVLLVLALVVASFSTQQGLQPGARVARQGARRTASRVLLGLALLSGAFDYLLLPLKSKNNWQGEPWSVQVRRWQRDPATPLQPFPREWQTFHLPPRTLPRQQDQ